MGGFSPIHWIVIGVVALLLFGNRLPEVARSLGKAWNEFKRGLHEVSDELKSDPDDQSQQDRLSPPEHSTSDTDRQIDASHNAPDVDPAGQSEEQKVNESR